MLRIAAGCGGEEEKETEVCQRRRDGRFRRPGLRLELETLLKGNRTKH